MSGPPRKPPGPPPMAPPVRPPLVDANQTIRGVGEIKKPPGAPPGPPPAAAIKPPPMAPPPRTLMQTQQRPPLEGIKPIEASKLATAANPSPNVSVKTPAQPVNSGRGPPPRVIFPDQSNLDEPINMKGAAPPKLNMAARPSPVSRKAGAISMFETQPEVVAIAEKKPNTIEPPQALPQGAPRPGPPPRGVVVAADPTLPMVRTPRPLPPRPQPAGIPEGHPLPPESKPEKVVKDVAPVKPAPNRNRAPPRHDPDARPEKFDVKPPDTEPPFVKGRKVEAEEIFVPRRQRENPEFESSSDEEGDESNRQTRKTKPKIPATVAQSIASEIKVPEAQVIDSKSESLIGSPEAVGLTPAAALSAAPAPVPSADPALASVSAPASAAAVPSSSLVPASDPSMIPISTLPRNVLSTGDKDIPPEDVVDEILTTDFIAPPSAEFTLDFTSKLAKQLTNGRLSIRCIEGIDVRRKDDLNKIPRTDPFLRFRLGAAERHPWVTTSVKRKQDNNPKFDDEIVHFDVLDPIKYILDEDLHLTIELWNKSTLRDECMGTVSMSVVRFFGKPYIAFEERVPVCYPGTRKVNGKLRLEFIFEEARSGMFAITLFEARGLRNVDPLAKQDPYVQLSLGPNYSKRSSVIKNGGVQPYFAEEELLIFTDQSNWVHDLDVSILDEAIGMEKPIGSTHICLLPYMNVKSDDAAQETFDLFYIVQSDSETKSEVACGEIVLRLRFLPAGNLTVVVDRAKQVSFPESFTSTNASVSRIDSYVQLSLDGKAVRTIKKTPADKDGGSDPVWEYELNFDIVDQYMLDVEVYHQNILPGSADVLLGYTQISLLPVFRNGHTEFWTALKQKKVTGGAKEVGDIRLDLKFSGPVGVSFPQFRPEVDAFDDRMRKMPEKRSGVDEDEEDNSKIKQPISTIPSSEPIQPVEESQEPMDAVDGPPKPPPSEFSEEEIAAAFKFIDLDHNNFIGAKEIRHILVCMGEMITDEEIDTMISIIDSDGDGQVSFQEFRAMVMHPDPGNADMHKVIVQKRDDEILADKQAMGGKTTGLDLTTYQRQKEMTQREAKKKMLISFIAENEITFDYIKTAYQYFADMPKEKRMRGRIKFPEFCKALAVEPISEYRILHSLFDSEESQEVDFREFLLSMLNFVEVNKELRMRFSFTMFDERKSGFITQKEIEEILRGNHMISLASVHRKAETIMRQASATTSGSITMNELVVIAKKFPNILLPSIGITKS